MKLTIEMMSIALVFPLTLSQAFFEERSLKDPSNIVITVTYDNNEYDQTLQTAWGFSCFIRGTEKTILFDTGGNGKVLLSNMSRLKIDPLEVEVVILSHIHHDHVGGLASFLGKNPNVTVYLPRSFPASLKDEVQTYGAHTVNVGESLRICDNVYSTGELGTRIREQSLVINTERGLIVITGCAHPGILKVLRKTKEILKTNVYLVMGGFHLKDVSHAEIDKVVEEFRKEGVERVGPCHCSGNLARKLFRKAYGKDFIRVGVGKVIEIP